MCSTARYVSCSSDDYVQKCGHRKKYPESAQGSLPIQGRTIECCSNPASSKEDAKWN